MGMIMGKAMDDNLKKNQEFMVATQKATMERQLQMQNYMRETQMAIQMAKSRDMFHYWAAFYATIAVGGIAGFMKTKRPLPLVPLIPFGFVVTYLGDMAYGNKMDRIKAEADQILQNEMGLLNMPRPLPSMELLDERRKQE